MCAALVQVATGVSASDITCTCPATCPIAVAIVSGTTITLTTEVTVVSSVAAKLTTIETAIKADTATFATLLRNKVNAQANGPNVTAVDNTSFEFTVVGSMAASAFATSTTVATFFVCLWTLLSRTH